MEKRHFQKVILKMKLFHSLQSFTCHIVNTFQNNFHNFQSFVNPLCSCSLAIESTIHFLLRCLHFSNIRSTLLNSISEVLDSITNISDLSYCALVKILLFGDQNYTQVENAYVINATTKYLVDLERFIGPLLLWYMT